MAEASTGITGAFGKIGVFRPLYQRLETQEGIVSNDVLPPNILAIRREISDISAHPQLTNCRGMLSDPRQMTINAAKAVAVAASFLSSVFGVNAAEAVTPNLVLKKFFAVGEVTTWGSLSAWSACVVIDRIANDRFSYGRKIASSCSRETMMKVYWATLIVFSLCSEIPTLYVSYRYQQEEGDIGWGIFRTIVGTFFDSRSMDALTRQIANSNNIVTRYIYRGSNKATTFQARDNFCKLLREYLASAVEDPSTSVLRDVLALTENSDDPLRINSTLVGMLKIGSRRKVEYVQLQPAHMQTGIEVVKAVGSLPTLVEYFIEGMLVYSGCRLVTDNVLLIALILAMALTPSIYLSVDLNRSTHSNNLQQIASLTRNDLTLSNIRDKAPVTAGYTLALIITVFGLGSSVAIIRDLLGLDWWSILIMIIALTSSFIVGKSGMTSFVDYIHENFVLLKMSEAQKREKDAEWRMRAVIDYFQNMPAEAFSTFIDSLQVAGVSVQTLAQDIGSREHITSLAQALQLADASERA